MTSAADVLAAERGALCDTFAITDPAAPTLCEGCSAADLAAHLVVREHRPDALPGIVIGGPFSGHTDRLMARAKTRGYGAMIDTLRAGPPLLFRVGPSAAANVNENFVHHEDLRRARGLEPRVTDRALDDVVWGVLGFGLRIAALRLRGTVIVLETPDGRNRRAGRGRDTVTLQGPPGELALFLSGRKDAARVELAGPPAVVARVREATLGI
jgi:uncharacterized protein (TIGR03085 family)